ncbi:hypothetical protein GW755_04075 [bacterium]|nr:hypothetical protein [bacterium]
MPLNTFNKPHLTIPHDFLSSESSAIYLSSMLRTFGLSLIGIFLPIYLFNLYLPYTFNPDSFINSVFIISIFFLLESLSTLLTLFIFSRWIYKNVPFQKILLFSNLVLVIALVCLYNLEKLPILYFITPGFLGLVITCYWVPYHLFFIEKNGDKEGHYGKKLGMSAFLSRSVDALGPLFGGAILFTLGFKSLFLISSILIVISSLPILYDIKDVRHHIDSPKKIILRYLLNKKYIRVSLGLFGATAVFVVFNLFWPIVLLITLKDFSTIGILTFFSLFLSSAFGLIVGRIINPNNSKKIHAVGISLASLLHLLRIFVLLPLHVYSLDLFSRTNFVLYELPFVSKTYEIGRGNDAADFVIYREVAIHLFRIPVIILVMLSFLAFSNWRYIFVFAALGSAISFFISLQKK